MIGFCREKDIPGDRSHWMADLSDEIHVSQLCIPGTHDSGAMHGIDAAVCQSVPIAVQLRAGIRALDIRCRHVNDSFHIFHGIVDQKMTFDDVLNTLLAFFTHNNREVVYMLVQEEGSPEKNTRSFEDTFRDKYWNRHRNMFWDPASAGNTENPALGITRGRIVVIQNFPSKQLFGIRFKNRQQVMLQNDFDVGLGDTAKKCDAIRKHLDLSNPNKQRGLIYINFFSGVASNIAILTYTPSKVAKDVNEIMVKEIGKGRKYGSHTGICFFDFPSKDLIEAIINLNK